MRRTVITISENGAVNIPSAEIWMSEMELVELFGVVAPTLRAAIKAIYKNSGLCPTSTQRYSSVTSTSWATFYNLGVIIALAFYLKTYRAERIRRKSLETLCRLQKDENNLIILIDSKFPVN